MSGCTVIGRHELTYSTTTYEAVADPSGGQYAALLKSYHVTSVRGDRHAGEFPRELFREHGITYDLLDKSKSDFYVDALAIINSRRIELLDHPRANTQIANLERRTSRGGRDSVDHAPGGHDDLANVVCALAVQLAASTAFDWRAAGMTSEVMWGDGDLGVRRI